MLDTLGRSTCAPFAPVTMAVDGGVCRGVGRATLWFMRRLHPDPADVVTIADAYAGPLGGHEDRPWVGLCMVASLDGSTVIDGASAGLSSDNDGDVLARLRAVADVVIVGSATASGEGYGPPKKDGQRIGVVTGSGSVDTSTELFTSGAGFVITNERAEFDERGVDVLRVGTDEVDLATAIRRIPELSPGATYVQAEGGASLNGALADADLLDEINVTTSPMTVGGDGPRIVDTTADHAHRYELAQVLIDDECFVFTRWLRRR